MNFDWNYQEFSCAHWCHSQCLMKIIFVGWFAKQWVVTTVVEYYWWCFLSCTLDGILLMDVPNLEMFRWKLFLCMEWSFMLLSWTLFSSTSNCEAEEGWEHRTFWWNRPWRILRCMVLSAAHIRRAMRHNTCCCSYCLYLDGISFWLWLP